ncbi:MAG TPA: hypothetical protein VGG14_08820 [Candidatus Sulfotelmatobacter sp.]
MNRQLAEQVANAILYEGYMLYPYRSSSIKNQQRWTFGTLYPPQYSEVRAGTERSTLHSECMLQISNGSKAPATVHIQLRFLQLDSADECADRSSDFDVDPARELHSFTFRFAGIVGTLSIACQPIANHIFKLIIEATNATPIPPDSHRESALSRSLLSAHILLSAQNAEFISLFDPPPELAEAASGCKNPGNFPVLIGNQHERDMLLCSPILLYDYPQVAPESAGDFFDATEMDEMLTLRVMTLTDQEKNEMCANDHARNLLLRTEQTAREQLTKTHGTIRSMRPLSDSND